MSRPQTKNGTRQLMCPRSPPISGPTAKPSPTQVSNRPTTHSRSFASATSSTMAVAKNIALPRPHTPRSTASWTMLPLSAASTAAIATSVTPVARIFLYPNLPVAMTAGIMPIAMTAMYAVNSSSICQVVAPISAPMTGRIGSTTAMPAIAKNAVSAVA